jgi:hypothetical protein
MQVENSVVSALVVGPEAGELVFQGGWASALRLSLFSQALKMVSSGVKTRTSRVEFR